MQQKIPTIEEITRTLPKLRADFEGAHGKDSFKKYYYEILHGLESMQDDDKNPWNRMAHPALMAYLLNLGLGRYEELPKLNAAFKYYATRPTKDEGPELAANTDEMLASVHTIIATYLKPDIPGYDSHDHRTPCAA